ncbi:3528_t:CDS:2, partial [Ambispora gerdemannii]
QLKREFAKAKAGAADTGASLLTSSESRLDNVVFRSGLANTLRFARQLVGYKHVLVDGKIVNIPSYKIEPGQIDASKLRPGTKGLELEIETDTLMTSLTGSLEKIAGGPIVDAPFEKLVFIFQDNAEQELYDALLDDKNQSFELSFDKDKV